MDLLSHAKHNTNDSAKAVQHFGEEKVVQRGYYFSCSSRLSYWRLSVSCRLHIRLHRPAIRRREGQHGSAQKRSSTSLVVVGILFKQKDAERTTEEREAILELAPFVSIGTSRVQRRRWPMIGFDRKLLYRLKAKRREIAFASDRDAINRFMEEGQKIRDAGGVFDIRFDDCLRIEEVLVQNPSVKVSNTPPASRIFWSSSMKRLMASRSEANAISRRFAFKRYSSLRLNPIAQSVA